MDSVAIFSAMSIQRTPGERDEMARSFGYDDASGLEAAHMALVVSTCGCGRNFTAGAWAALTLVGVQDDGAGLPDSVLELRNCPCGSTRAVAVTLPR